jgi:hypothetical protein
MPAAARFLGASGWAALHRGAPDLQGAPAPLCGGVQSTQRAAMHSPALHDRDVYARECYHTKDPP